MPEPICRRVHVDASRDDVWRFLLDHQRKADMVDAIEEVHREDSRTTVWRVRLPLPLMRTHVTVRSRELSREAPHYVRFQVRAAFVRMTGEHELRATDDHGCDVINRFWVRSRVPGLRAAFRYQLDRQLPRLVSALQSS